MFCYDVADFYLESQNQRDRFKSFVITQQVKDYFSFFANVDQFAFRNKLKFELNNHTNDYSPVRKLTAKIFQYAILKLAKHINPIGRVRLSTGIQHDVVYNNIKIDAKLKNGVSKFFNKNYEITTAYNTQNNNNQSDYFCFGVCAKDYWKDNIIDFTICGVIKRQQFYQIARVRQINQVICNRFGEPTLKDGQQMIARKPDYVTYAQFLHKVQTIFN